MFKFSAVFAASFVLLAGVSATQAQKVDFKDTGAPLKAAAPDREIFSSGRESSHCATPR